MFLCFSEMNFLVLSKMQNGYEINIIENRVIGNLRICIQYQYLLILDFMMQTNVFDYGNL